MREAIRAFCNEEKGATAVEYGILIAILGLGVFGAAKPFANLLYAMWQKIADGFIGT